MLYLERPRYQDLDHTHFTFPTIVINDEHPYTFLWRYCLNYEDSWE